MSSIKQLIVNAIIKVSTENPALNREGEPSAEEARDHFIKCLLAELFPEDPSVPAPSPKKVKKTKAKKTEEVAPPPLEKVPETEVEVVAEPAAEPSPGRKKRAPMTEEAKAAMKAKREATLAAKKAGAGQPVSPAPETAVSNAAAGAGSAPATAEPEVKEKKPRKPKAVAPEGSNLGSIDPTWRKHLKKADKDHAKELEPELLNYLNGLSKEEFDGKKAEDHVADFIASRVAKADDKVETDLTVVEFNGKEYFVNPETKRVYEGEGTYEEETGWTNYKPVGYVGMAAFAEMKLED